MSSRTLRLALAAVPLLLTAACSNQPAANSEIDDLLCTQEDLGPDYIELSRGEFTTADIAALAPGANEHAYRDAGMQRGHFIFWKQVLSNPPFDPPMNVLCQAIEFETPDRAAAFASGLDDSAPPWAGIAWLPEHNLIVESAGQDLQRISFNDAGQDVSVLVGYRATGRFFSSIYLGSSGAPPEESAITTIADRVAHRNE